MLILFRIFWLACIFCQSKDTGICVYAVQPDGKETEPGRTLHASQLVGIDTVMSLCNGAHRSVSFKLFPVL